MIKAFKSDCVIIDGCGLKGYRLVVATEERERYIAFKETATDKELACLLRSLADEIEGK